LGEILPLNVSNGFLPNSKIPILPARKGDSEVYPYCKPVIHKAFYVHSKSSKTRHFIFKKRYLINQTNKNTDSMYLFD
jgi:hypothetical protein